MITSKHYKMFWKYQLSLTIELCHLISLLAYWYSVWHFCPLILMGFRVSLLYCISISFFFFFLYICKHFFFFPVLRCSCTGCIYFNNSLLYLTLLSLYSVFYFLWLLFQSLFYLIWVFCYLPFFLFFFLIYFFNLNLFILIGV